MKDRINVLAKAIKVENIQKLQDTFITLFQVPITLLDVKGTSITENTIEEIVPKKEVLELVNRNQKTLLEARKELPERGIVTETLPLILKNHLLGSWAFVYPMHDNKREDFIQYLRSANQVLEVTLENNKNIYDIFDDFINLTNANMVLTDYESGKIIMCNDQYRESLQNYEKISVSENTSIYDFEIEFIPKEIREALRGEEEQNKQSYTWEIYVERLSKWFEFVSRSINWMDGRLAILTTFADITEKKNEEERIHYLAYNDKRLGIPNGIKLFEDIQNLGINSHYMICFNVQGLRKVNNLYGRESGDKLLKNIVTWISKVLNFRYPIYRIEKDDFVVFADNSSELETMNVARFLHNRFEQPWDIDLDEVFQEIFVGVHMGVIEVDNSMESYERMQNVIDKVMTYARKENRLILFDERINEELKELLKFEEDLKFCVLNNMNGFSLNFQPIVEAATGRWIGCEALCRWNRPEFGPVRPDLFILEAEKLGLINILTKWVLTEAIRNVKEWELDKCERFMLDVNLSPIQLRDRELVGLIREVLNYYNYPAEKLSLEITESAEVHFDEKTLKQLDYIRETGISLSLDDFGIGYATFSNLRVLPVDVLKTDRSFMMGIEEDEYLQYMMKVMVEFAHAADIEVIAEGVETEEQLNILKENGVGMIQGYYFSRPLPTDLMEENLHKFQ
ncbi:EAL domain-containing protein (putative c-di-GMP-specific phosphodiesterase class I)/GGDEF domain-containing protein [Aequitasia blattaphilus]|uniref:Bifunctional diguanylate cyclase/phosphodiesterase n=1 Tax=Aequitasia blattaphilus TaxID=2949332 RepID=A0ABT1E950_9FIRM|nr:bifunctional diguanylate cyclase/phosphodiesterase [Aequitasia blattaphilus]MCP1102358.1 bifunctional diguanylate cyclase/phosphodiesterase [Aequitasia blattaphilus]MCR8614998.1 bifunctional diguanylate cyclase/phosphodiesterase [Aequitasia blattaphilus]